MPKLQRYGATPHISLRPEILSPTDPLEMGETFAQVAGTVAFQQVGNLSWTNARRGRHNYMYIVLIGLQRKERQVVALATLANQFLCSLLDIPRENRAPIHRNPHQMIGD